MKHLGDITKLKGSEVPLVDIVTGGSPCQDLSVAGKREGLSGERSGLFMEQIRIIKEMRNECIRQLRGTDYDRSMVKPRYMVWENVSGAFSSNKGEDFRAVLEETAKIADENATIPRPEKWQPCGCIMGDGYSIAWRVHDAQFWGVPQRRKRICLLADFNGDTAPRILFELQRKTADGEAEQVVGHLGTESRSEVSAVSQGMSGNSTESREEGQETTAVTGKDADKTGSCLNSWDVQSKRIQPENGKANSLYSGQNAYTGAESYVMQSRGLRISGYESNAMKSSNPHSGIYEAETTRTLDNNGGNPACNQGGMMVVQAAGFSYGQSDKAGSIGYQENVSPTLRGGEGGNQKPCVCTYQETTEALCASGYDKLGVQEAMNDMYVVQKGMAMQGANWDGSQISPTLTANNAGGSQRMPDKENFNAVITYNDPKLMDAYQHHGYRESETCGTLTAEQNQTVRGDTPLIVEDKPVTVNNSSYGGYEKSEISGSLKVSGGDRGGQRIISDTVGAICARDFKGVGNQYVDEGKCVIQCYRKPSDRQPDKDMRGRSISDIIKQNGNRG